MNNQLFKATIKEGNQIFPYTTEYCNKYEITDNELGR